MISHLDIKGFKSILGVSVDLGSVNFFIGANGSGKSNLLESVGMLAGIASGGLGDESLRYRGVRSGPPSSFCASFKQMLSAPISIAANDSKTAYRVGVIPVPFNPSLWEVIREEIDFDGNKIFERQQDGVVLFQHPEGYFAKLPYNAATRSDTRTSLSLYGIGMRTLPDGSFQLQTVLDKDAKKDVTRVTTGFLDFLSNYAIFTPSTPQLRGSLDDIHRDPVGLGGSGLAKAIEEMTRSDPELLGPFDINEVYDLIEWADDLGMDLINECSGNGSPPRLRIGDRFMGDAHRSVSALEASEGALYVLFLLALVGHERSPKLFAVDNFDQALHPRLARELTRLVCDQIVSDGTRQMLATTHNPLVLDGLDLLDDRIRLFAVSRDPAGATRVDRVTVTEELMAQAEDGLSLSRLWVMGRLGGVPHNL